LLAKWSSLFAAVIIVLTTGAQARSQTAGNWDPFGSPNLSDIGRRNLDQNKLRQKSFHKIKQDNKLSKWTTIPEGSPLIDLPWQSFSTDYNKGIRDNDGFKTFQSLSAAGESKAPIDQFQFGDSYFGIQTQKTFQIPQLSGQPDCTTDDECADYSGLPKAKQPKTTTKNLRKPFIGLSITSPLK
jgi:hypothetical protein